MTARDVYEASFYAALARYKQAVAEGTYRVVADNTFADAMLRAWEKSQVAAARAAYAMRGVPAPAPPAPAAPARTKASADAARAARRAKISPQAAAARVRDEAGQWAAL